MHSRPLSARPTRTRGTGNGSGTGTGGGFPSAASPPPAATSSSHRPAQAHTLSVRLDTTQARSHMQDYKAKAEAEEVEDKGSSSGGEFPAVDIVISTVAEIKRRRLEQDSKLTEEEIARRNEALRAKYDAILTYSSDEPLPERIMKLRRLVISEGLPAETEEERRVSTNRVRTTLRGTVWKVLLGALHMDSDHYVKLVAEGPSWADKKIRDDTFRTFQGDAEFRSRVSEVSIARVLNSFVRQNFTNEQEERENEDQGQKDGPTTNQQSGYVQGMNVLLAPFMFVMPEVDAFFCFNALITRHCPRYVLANLDGTHHGCSLVDRVLNIMDPELFLYLNRKSLSATVYAFPMIMTLMASLQPLSQVLCVWDATFAFGVHLDVLLCVCVCMLMRDKLLNDPNPFQHLMPRALGNSVLDAEILVTCALKLLRQVPPSLFEELVRHPVEKPVNTGNILSIKPGEGESRPGSAGDFIRSRRHSNIRDDSTTRMKEVIAPDPNTRLVTSTHERTHRRRKSKSLASRRARHAKSSTSPGPIVLRNTLTLATDTQVDAAEKIPTHPTSPTSSPVPSTRLYAVHTQASRGQMREKHMKKEP